MLSLFAMVGGSFVAAFGYIQISQLSKNPLSRDEQIALWIQSILFTFLGLIAIFGFVGCLIKNRRMVSHFAVSLAIHLGLGIAAGIYSIVSIFRQDPQQGIDNCLNSGTEGVTEDTCRTSLNIMKGVMVGIYVLTWLVQLYAYFVVERYVDQLDDEREAANMVVMPQGAAQMATTYGGFPPQYPFTAPAATRGPDASNRV